MFASFMRLRLKKDRFWAPCLLILLLTSLFGLAQRGASSAKEEMYRELSRADSLLDYDPLKAKAIAQGVLELALARKADTLIADAFQFIGDGNYYRNNLDSALHFYQQSYNYYRKIGDTIGMSFALFSLGHAHKDKGDYALAVRYFHKSLELDLAFGDSLYEAFSYTAIAGIHLEQGDLEIAREKFEKALAIDEDHQLPSMRISALEGLCKIYLLQNQLSKANFYLEQLNQVAQGTQDLLVKAEVNVLHAIYYAKTEDKEMAIKHVLLAERAVDTYQDPYSIIEIYSQISSIYGSFGYESTALDRASRAVLLAEDQPGAYLQRMAYQAAYEASKKRGRTEEALLYHEKLLEATDSLHNRSIISILKESRISNQEQENRILREQASLKEKIITRDFYIQLSLSILVIVFVCLVLLSFNTGQKRLKHSREIQYKNLEIEHQQEQLNKAHAELLEKNNELEQQNKNKDKVFSILSHDLREPFNQLGGVLSLIENDLIEREDMLEVLPKLKESVFNAQTSVVNLLHWSKNQLAQIRTEPERFKVASVVENLRKSLEPTFDRKNLKVVASVEDELELLADYYQIEIGLRNLLTNAIKFSPAGSQIKITAKLIQESKEVQISVQDEGSGLSEEQIARLLAEDGNPSESSRGTSNERGTGLGLSIVKDFLHANGGYLTIENASPQGSIFTMHLPYLL